MIKYLFAGLLLSSCYTPRYVYSPSAHNVPLFSKKNDSKIAANYSSNLSLANSSENENDSYGFDLQGAYAISDHWALQANY